MSDLKKRIERIERARPDWRNADDMSDDALAWVIAKGVWENEQTTPPIARLERCGGHSDWQKQIERFKQRAPFTLDAWECIARGEWDRVPGAETIPPHIRERLTRAAPTLLTALDLDKLTGNE